jgi:hypothetical protein
MDWTAITAIGTVLGGLALPLAFIQLDAQRRERLRAQVSKLGGWTEVYMLSDPERPVSLPAFGAFSMADNPPNEWVIRLFIRNSSDLPVIIHKVEVSITEWGYNIEEKTDDRPGRRMSPTFETANTTDMLRDHTLKPDSTHSEPMTLLGQAQRFDRPQPPKVSINRIVVTDAAGLLWETRTALARPPKRIYSTNR